MSDQVLSALEHFFLRWQRDGEARRGLPLCEWEADWRSPCELDEPKEGGWPGARIGAPSPPISRR